MKLELLHMKKTTQKFTVINYSLTYYVSHVSIVYGVAFCGISIEICVVFEGLIWSKKNTSYIAPYSEVSVGLVLPKLKKQYTRKMKQ